MNGGSFLDGFADGALNGAITGAIAGAAFSGIGVVGSALGNYLGGSCKFANCAGKILNILKCTSKVTGVLSLGMEAFDSLSMIVGIFDPDNPSVVFNHKLHSSSLYNTFQIGDILVNSDREIYPVENIFFEVVEKPETVYNFQVEDFHTYHVSESSVLVHNAKNYKNYDPYDDISPKEKMGKRHGDTPQNNQAQNKDFKYVADKYGLNKAQRRILHDEITGQGFGKKAIEQIAKELFGK